MKEKKLKLQQTKETYVTSYTEIYKVIEERHSAWEKAVLKKMETVCERIMNSSYKRLTKSNICCIIDFIKYEKVDV